MKKIKRVTAVFVAICMIFAFTACDGNEQKKDVMKTSINNIEEVDSMTSETYVEFAGTIEGQDVNINTAISHRMITSPFAMKMEVGITSDEGGKQQTKSTKMYAESSGINCVLYYQINDKWYKETEEGNDDFRHYNTAETAKIYMKSVKDVRRTGSDIISGAAADRYEGVISENDFKTVFDESDLDHRFEIDDFDDFKTSNLNSIFDGVGDIPMTIWLDSDNMRPVKYQFDMTDAVKIMLGNLDTRGEKITVSKVHMSTVITGYNNVDKITIPEAARQAGILDL